MERSAFTTKMSPFLLIIVIVTLVLALAFIFMGLQAYLGDKFEDGNINFTIGMALLAVSTYLLFQTKRRPLTQTPQQQPLNTTILCKKCGFKNVREFQRGDYVLKELDEACPKCNEKTLEINAVFREVKEKKPMID